MNLPELLQWIQYGQKTGTAVFERRGVVKKVFVDSGQIIAASSNDPREYLGQILVCCGWISESQLRNAFQKQRIAKKLLGQILVDDLGLSEEQIFQSLVMKIEETVYNIFLWEDGRFIYYEGLKDLADHDRIKTALSIDQVLFEGARRVDELREFRRAFPDDRVVFKIKPDRILPVEFETNPLLRKVYDLIDGRKNLQRILLDSHAPEYLGYEAVGKLYWGDYIEALDQGHARAHSKSIDYQADLLKAAEFFKMKRYDEAYRVIEDFILLRPDNEEGQTLFGAIREAYRKNLYETCPPQMIPMLSTDINDLNEEIFSGKDGYLASRINGDWDIKSLIMISPMGELKSLETLKRLHDEGIISFNEPKGESQ